MPRIKPIESSEYRTKPLVSCLAEAFPARLGDGYRDFEHWWNGDRLFVSIEWKSSFGEPNATIRLQYQPHSKAVWIGYLKIKESIRGKGLGKALVTAIEFGSGNQGFESVRLFSTWRAKSFWTHLGYIPESDPRFLRKALTT